MSAAPLPPTTRRHDLDWIRVLAFGLLILFHVGMYYVDWDWHVKSPFASRALEPVMLASAPWRLSLLFLVSGAATAFLLDRPGPFMGSRNWRLLLPLAFGMLVVVPPQSYYEVVTKLGYGDGYLAFWGRYLRADGSFCRDGACLILPTWNHLWFVAYLWAYTVLLWTLHRLWPGGLARAGEHVRARLATRWGVLLWPALLLALARVALVGRFESTHALVDDWYNHAQYLPVFLLGYWIASDDAAFERLRTLRWPALALAAAGYAVVAWYVVHFHDANPPTDTVRSLQRCAWGLVQWGAIAAILGFGRQLSPGDGPLLRYLTQAVFPFYILHQTVIVVLAQRLQPLGLRPWLEGPLLVASTAVLCLLGFEFVRRVRWLRPLFGLKPQPRLAQLRGAPQAAG